MCGRIRSIGGGRMHGGHRHCGGERRAQKVYSDEHVNWPIVSDLESRG